ncbi:MAG: hypothetical protein PVH96_11720 [Gemmatimonadota bacterium]|jgi:hypothetical protein
MRHGVPLAALLSAVLVGVVATACREQPTGPEADGTAPVRPRFSFTGGSGKILASTNQGELVEIDFDAGTAELLGDAGTFGGDSVGWTDIAFDDSGTLYGVSRIFFESDFEVHLYTIDPSDGSVISDLGSIGDHTFSDFDHDGSGFYGNGKNDLFDCCGQLFSLDETTPSATWISSDTTGFGLNPYDTVHDYPLTQGGFAVHPSTGELWGIESNAFVPTIFRIDRSSGVADSVIPLAVDSGAVLDAGGFDGLHILDDGTFIATLSGPSPLDSALWEIDPTLDSLGRAPVGLISLAYGSEIVGHLNGLTRAAPPAYSLTLTADTTELHPWVRYFQPFGTPPAYVQQERVGDSATLTVKITNNGSPAVAQEVTVRAKWINERGGHSHYPDTLDLEDTPPPSPNLPGNQAGESLPAITGAFVQADDTISVLTDSTDSSGELSLRFVAGYVSGQLEIVASTAFSGDSLADTLTVHIRVPGLVALQADASLQADAYFVGATVDHPRDSTWYATPSLDTALVTLLAFLTDTTLVDVGHYIQVNDASLPWGGAFTVDSAALADSIAVERPNMGHRTHNLGLDVDIAWCYALDHGEDGGASRISGTNCAANSTEDVPWLDLQSLAEGTGLKALREDTGQPHYHLRLR